MRRGSSEWDVRNQLVAIAVGVDRTEFTCDGRQRRVRVVTRQNTVIQSDTRIVWCETKICEERAADGTTVLRRVFERGEEVAGAARYFTLDRLGSVREVTDASVTLMGRYDFDPSGRRTLVSGTEVTNIGYTGHFWEPLCGLWLTHYAPMTRSSDDGCLRIRWRRGLRWTTAAPWHPCRMGRAATHT